MGSRLFTSTATDLGHRFVRRCAPASGLADRSLILVHGAGEHSGRYSHLVPHIVARGWNLIAGDLSGHGQSGGVPTHLDSFEQYLADVESMHRHYDLVPERTALIGHSMGGLVSARFVQTRPRSVAALVLSAPLLAFGMDVPFARRVLGRVCLAVAPRTRFQTRVQLEDVTRNLEARRRRMEDPLTNRTVTAGWYFNILRTLQQVADDASRLQIPLLLMQGAADRIVPPEAAARWFAQVGPADKSLWLFREHLHELLNEPDWEQTLSAMLDWLEVRIPATSGGVQASACPLDAKAPLPTGAA
jgi:lysophospholipase